VTIYRGAYAAYLKLPQSVPRSCILFPTCRSDTVCVLPVPVLFSRIFFPFPRGNLSRPCFSPPRDPPKGSNPLCPIKKWVLFFSLSLSKIPQPCFFVGFRYYSVHPPGPTPQSLTGCRWCQSPQARKVVNVPLDHSVYLPYTRESTIQLLPGLFSAT